MEKTISKQSPWPENETGERGWQRNVFEDKAIDKATTEYLRYYRQEGKWYPDGNIQNNQLNYSVVRLLKL